MKQTLKHTQIAELRIEQELYKRELIRLRTQLEMEMEGKPSSPLRSTKVLVKTSSDAAKMA